MVHKCCMSDPIKTLEEGAHRCAICPMASVSLILFRQSVDLLLCNPI